MEIFYPADSARLPVETISDLNAEIFEGWEDGDMPFLDSDNMPEHMRIITENEFIEGELNGD